MARSFRDGPGTAQALRFLNDTCARIYGVKLTIGWVLRGNTGQKSYIFQNWTLVKLRWLLW